MGQRGSRSWLMVACFCCGALPAFAKHLARAPHAPRMWVGRGVELEPGWHEGPFILLGTGVITTDHDNNLITGERFGADFAQAFVGGFGYNVTDAFGAEMYVRWAHQDGTFDGENHTEWAAAANLDARYAFIRPWCYLGHEMKLIPYLKGGGVLYAIAVRGGTRNEGKAGGLGTGLDFGGGLEFNFGHKPASFMVDLSVDETFLIMDRKYSGTVEITNGKFDNQFSAQLLFGVHF